VLTSKKGCDIIIKLSPRGTAKRSLKIEQQEISTKQKASANLVLKELYILNKVKEAKIK
jgi:hypothetical protein